MSAMDPARDRFTAVDTVAGFLAASALALAGVAVFYLPGRLSSAAIVLALVAARMSTRFQRLALTAAVAGALAWVVGMTIALFTENPLI